MSPITCLGGRARASRRLQSGLALAVLLALGACSATKPKPFYQAAEAQQLRAAAEATASSATSSAAMANTASTYIRLVDQMQRDGLWFASLAHIDALEQRWGVSPESNRLRADALRQTDQPEASRRMYDKLIGTPLEGAGYHGLGLLAGSQSDFPLAIRMLEQAQRRNPIDALLLSDMGYAQMRAGQLPAARIPLMQALQLQPDNQRIQVNVALYLQASGQTEQALALMNASNMPAATRSVIADAASRMAVGVVPAAAPDAALSLKTAAWPRRVHVMVRPDPLATDSPNTLPTLLPAGDKP
ncbi:hypothetical protein [Variovorax ginsengisoli]|uniref:Flp pilus assembly protein TadD n=1 Tax=Variovorax ginsengisoli TaxID=363844 RepID=A0ABT9SEB9_9BURK|nr:hypothetical protein [Variovorax ginsengisoli]MDP9902708.1 Flp pilus assembly protein TadD [Variovorax ginsengisoli]